MEGKIREIINRMTVEEKVAQLGCVYITQLFEDGKLSREKMENLLKNGIGEIGRAVGGIKGMEPEDAVEIIFKIQKFLKEETRLGIPALFHEECLSGYMVKGATTFPQAIGLASTWNLPLVQKIASVIREQMKNTHVHHALSPLLDVCYDPRWGRVEETFGEDPYLVASMGVSYVKGLQGKNIKEGIMATGKHFAGYGFPEGGRNLSPVHIGERELRDIFLFPFEACVKVAGLSSIMNAYHDLDGIPCACSTRLLTDILRKEWGFDGIVVSDYNSIRMLYNFHFVAKDKKEAGILAIKAGIDIELPNIDCYKELAGAVKEGLIDESIIDQAVFRVLKIKFEKGLFEEKIEKKKFYFDTRKDRNLARKTARESIVLLKNNGILPISKNIKSISIIGQPAEDKRLYFGDYSYTSHLDFEEPSVKCKSILDVAKERFGKRKVFYAKGFDIDKFSKDGFKEAKDVAEKSELVIIVCGERSGLSERCTVGEGRDSHNIKLPGVQEELVKEIAEKGKKIILILINGRPLDISEIVDKVDAILEAWFPGEETAEAIWDIILGKYNPSGKLPVSFPKSVGQIPCYYHRKESSKKKYVSLDSQPLFPFGYGLSYTEFEYSNIGIEKKKISPGEKIIVKAEVENKGEREGSEVVQLYVKDMVASVVPPSLQLKGFVKVNLKPKEKVKIIFEIPSEILAFHNQDMKLVIEPGKYKVFIGSSSADLKLEEEFEIEGEPKFIRKRKKFFSKVKIER